LQSIWMLEILLFLRRRAGDQVSREEIVREMRATPSLVSGVLDRLHAGHLVSLQENGDASFAPSTPELAILCEKLEAASRDRPIALRDAIIGSTGTKLQDLADAFRLSGGTKDR
jgi:DNA-binding GntR family transcriptional regulator